VIASQPVAVARVLSRRNAGKLSWRRAASKRGDEVGVCRLEGYPVISGGRYRVTGKLACRVQVQYSGFCSPRGSVEFRSVLANTAKFTRYRHPPIGSDGERD